VNPNYRESIVVNRIGGGDARDQKENLDAGFGQMWQSVIQGGKTPPKDRLEAQ